MILYHGSNIAFDHIDLCKSRPNKDFGKAFYLSDDKTQAEEMASFKVLREGKGEVVISSYEFDEKLMTDDNLKVLVFTEYSREWAEFIFANRDENQDFKHEYDIVYGPIANDTVGAQIRMYRSLHLSLDNFLRNLQYHKGITFQYAFCSKKAISKLKKI